MAKKRRRIFNYRPMCIAALALILGIIVAEALYSEPLALIAIPLTICGAAFVALLIFPKTRKLFYIPLAIMVGFSAMTASAAVYDSKIKYTEYSPIVDMTATVSGMIMVEDGQTVFYVHDLYVEGERLDFDGYALVYFEFTPDFNAGDVIAMRGYVLGRKHEKFGDAFPNAVAKRVGYSLYVSEIGKLSEGRLRFPRNVQHAVKGAFYDKLDPQTASICNALIFGDKFGMDDDLRRGVMSSGLSHVLAVSGLHITTLATALYFMLKKLKVKPWVGLIAVTALTFVYVVLCSFAASALRAFVMSAVFNFASCFGRKRDNLSAVAFAGILILSFRPTALFEVGFLLSFSSMLGIFLFHKSVNDAGQKAVNLLSPKRHIGSRAMQLACVSVSATLMSYPFIAYYFGYIPLFQMLSNIVFVPYIMVCYVLLLILTVFAMLTTLTPVIYVMRILLFPFIHYVQWVGGLSASVLPLPPISVPAIVCYVLIAVFMSRYNLMPRKDKLRGGLTASAVAIALCAALALL